MTPSTLSTGEPQPTPVDRVTLTALTVTANKRYTGIDATLTFRNNSNTELNANIPVLITPAGTTTPAVSTVIHTVALKLLPQGTDTVRIPIPTGEPTSLTGPGLYRVHAFPDRADWASATFERGSRSTFES